MNVAHCHFGWSVRCRVALLSLFHFLYFGNFLLTHASCVLTVASFLALFPGLGFGRR